MQLHDWATKKRFAHEIASGMALVHSLGRMHRDLKSGNVLATAVQGRVILKVADFGTVTLAASGGWQMLEQSTRRESAETTTAIGVIRLKTQLTKGIGTPLWMAPEILAGHRYGQSADVYSYAIVMWEIAAQAEPWADVDGSFLACKLLDKIDAGERPPVSPEWPGDYVTLMQRCWAREPTLRPSFHDITSTLGSGAE
jgi:LRR receptor-like serine/threonine-protein kinase FLS2